MPINKAYIELTDFFSGTGRVYLTPEQMVAPEGGYISIPLAEFGPVNIAEISAISFGVDNFDGSPADVSTIYIDDIKISSPKCSVEIKADFNGDCTVNMIDLAEFSSYWLDSVPLWP